MSVHAPSEIGVRAAVDAGVDSVEHGNLVATYMRSKFEDTRQKARKFGANGATVKAYKPS